MNEFNRRDALAGGRLLAAATSLGCGRADAAQARVPPGTGRFKAIDATMRKAVDAGTVAGVVAIGATRRGIVYEGSFGKAQCRHRLADDAGLGVLAAIDDQGLHGQVALYDDFERSFYAGFGQA
jgi:hypothetical protein